MSIRPCGFWATPPIHGVLTPTVVHPANYTFKLPDNVSFAEGAMVEPFAVGMQAAHKAGIAPGDTAVVLGAGPIGIMVAIAALAGGCARAIVADLAQPKLDIAARYQGVIPVNIREQGIVAEVQRLTEDWGADVVFECSGSPKAWETILDLVRARRHRRRSRPARGAGSVRRLDGLDQGGAHRERVSLCASVRPRRSRCSRPAGSTSSP